MTYLLDLERSLLFNHLVFWKPNERGYTSHLNEAGLYPEGKAQMLAKSDLDGRTLVIKKEVVEGII